MNNKTGQLQKMALWNLAQLSGEPGETMDKEAFEPMPAGGAGAAAAPPMDPAMAAAGGAPMDPMAAGAGPAVSLPPPAAAPIAPAAPPPGGGGDPAYDMIVQAVRQVVQEMGVAPGAAPGGESKPAKDMEARLGAVEGALAQVLEMMGLANPEQAMSQAVEEAAPAPGAAAGMGAGAGQPAEGAGAVPLGAGPMDPGSAQAMQGMAPPGAMQIAASGPRPLDGESVTDRMAEILKRSRPGK